MDEPTRIGELEVIRRLGAGGFGVVYLANDRRLGRRVAVKLAHSGRGDLWREARAAARLAHPNVVAIHEIGEHAGSAYLVMEYVDGPALRERLTRGAMPRAEALQIARALASAIAAAHREGVIHLDLTPANVLLAPDGRARVVDFGLARAADTFGARVEDLAGPQLSIAAGTPTYMAPEQWRAEKLGPPADVWALGAILHVLVTGAPPVDGSIERVRDRVTGASPLELASLGDDALAQVIRTCLAKDPAARPTAEDVAAKLDALAAQLAQPSPFRDHTLVPRTAVITALAAAVRAHRLVVVTGPARSGKSALVAELVAVLHAEGERVALVDPGARPLHAIATALRASVSGAVVATRSDLDTAPATIDDQVTRWTASPERFAADLEDAAAAVGRFVLVVDPLAELDAAATACLAAAAADDGIAHLVFVTGDAEASPLAALDQRFVVPPPSVAELRAMLEQPVHAAGYRFAPGVSETAARALAAHATPLAQLAVVGAALWDTRDRETCTIPGPPAPSRRLIRFGLAGVALAAAALATFAIARREGTSRTATAATPGPQCIGAFFPKQTMRAELNAYGQQDALAGISSDGKSVLVLRRDCTTDDWRIVIVDKPGPTTRDVTELPALAEFDPAEIYLTMTSDALTLVGTDRAHARLLSASRSAIDREDFALAVPNAFAAISVAPPAWISHPVLSQDALEVFYTVHDEAARPDRRAWIHTARRRSTSEPFPPGQPIGPEFHGMEIVTGLSADHLTIFAGVVYGLAMFTRASRDVPFGNPNIPTAPPTVPGFRTRPIGDCTMLAGTCTNGCNNEEVCFYSR